MVSGDTPPRRLAVLLIAALVVALVGCSRNDENGSEASTPNSSQSSTTSAAVASPTEAPTVTTEPDCGPAALAASTPGPVKIIMDTDFSSDVDDVGALAVLHALADLGEVELLAVMVSELGDGNAPQAIDAVNTYYGRSGIPIGVVSGLAPQHPSRYTAEIATLFPHSVRDTPPAVGLYRSILADAPDNTVTIVSVGFLTNLAGLLVSQRDSHSELSGAELVSAKVNRLVVMGGYFPDSADHPRGAEFNFAKDAIAAAITASRWPTPIVFSGWEIGSTILTGAVLQSATPEDNPVREAYRLFNGGEDHRSFDLTAALFAVRGSAGLFDVTVGRSVVGSDGSNTFEVDETGCHAYLTTTVSDDEIASVLDKLLAAQPKSTADPSG